MVNILRECHVSMKKLSDFPRECIGIDSEISDDVAKKILDAAYKNYLKDIDASYFKIAEARLFKYPINKFPTLKFWASAIKDTSKWYKEGNQVRSLELPIRYNFELDEM